jgi:hypothetical protein
MKAATREKVLAALLCCNTKTEAAKLAGVSVRTVHTYLQDPDFAAEYTQAKKNLIQEAGDQIKRSLGPAIEALHTIAIDPKAGKTARVQAARTLLEFGIRLDEHTEVLARLDALEQGKGASE